MKNILWAAIIIGLLIGYGKMKDEEKPKPTKEEQQMRKHRDALEYLILEHISHNGPVICDAKKIDGKGFVLCSWGRQKALFLIDGPSHLYAVNGQARRPAFTHYTDISPYPKRDINIPAVIDKIEKR